MMEKRVININELKSILETHYGYKSLSIERIRSGITIKDIGPGGSLDILLEVDDGEDDRNKEIFSFNAVNRIGKRMAKQTQRIDALEWYIKNVETHLMELKKEMIKQKPVTINPDPELKEEWKLT